MKTRIIGVHGLSRVFVTSIYSKSWLAPMKTRIIRVYGLQGCRPASDSNKSTLYEKVIFKYK